MHLGFVSCFADASKAIIKQEIRFMPGEISIHKYLSNLVDSGTDRNVNFKKKNIFIDVIKNINKNILKGAMICCYCELNDLISP